VPARKFVGKTYRLNFDIPQAMRDELFDAAAEEGIPATDLMRRIIRDYLEDGFEPVQANQFPRSEREIFTQFVNQVRLLTDRYDSMFAMLEHEKSEFGTPEEMRIRLSSLTFALKVAQIEKKSKEVNDFLYEHLQKYYQVDRSEVDKTLLGQTKEGYLEDLKADGFDINS
jgi:hypothetical protein